jgi:hypothetical protein
MPIARRNLMVGTAAGLELPANNYVRKAYPGI